VISEELLESGFVDAVHDLRCLVLVANALRQRE
jgi:hypothetical protein